MAQYRLQLGDALPVVVNGTLSRTDSGSYVLTSDDGETVAEYAEDEVKQVEELHVPQEIPVPVKLDAGASE